MNASMFDVDSRIKIYLAHIIYDSGRIDDSVILLRSLIESKFAFQEADRKLALSAWLSLITSRRSAIINLREDLKGRDCLNSVVGPLNEQLLSLLDEIIQTINQSFLPNASDDDAKINTSKFLADFLRYKVECCPEADKAAVGAAAKAQYERLLESLKASRTQPFDSSLQVSLNYAILLANHLGNRPQAIKFLSQLHHDTTISLDKYSDEMKAKIGGYLDLMTENLNRWKALEPQQPAQ